MDEARDDDGPAMPDGVMVAEAASHGGFFGIGVAALAAVLAAVLLRSGKRRRQ